MTNAKLQLESADDDDAKKPPRKTALDFSDDDDSPLITIVNEGYSVIGNFSVKNALRRARETGSRLYLIKPEANPPVARMMQEPVSETVAIKIQPPIGSRVQEISRRHSVVLHVRLEMFRDLKSADEVEEQLCGLITAYLQIEVDSYFPNNELKGFAQEIWLRWVSGSINQ